MYWLFAGTNCLTCLLYTSCVDWSWTEDVETHTVCLTSDGVLLRLVVDGNKVIEARSVSYGQQRPELFEVPPGYEPALAPEGGPGP